MSKKTLYWTLQLGGWLLFAATQMIFRLFSTGNIDYFFALEAFILLLVTHCFRWIINRLQWIELPMIKLFPRLITSAFLLGFIVYWVRYFIAIPLGFFQEGSVLNIPAVLTISAVFSFIIFIWLVLYFAYHYFINYNNALKNEAVLKEVELNNLKSQLNPHFIFNSLNSIRALVDENPVQSKKAITQLSGILRNSLISDKKGLIPFGQEMETVKAYLGLESMRYEERLKVEIDMEPESKDFNIPPLMLQTLVENGIKHGIAKLKMGGKLEIKSRVKKNNLVIEIWNSGFYDEDSETQGLGIRNTRKRLKLIYGDDALFLIKNVNNSVMTVLNLPKREEL